MDSKRMISRYKTLCTVGLAIWLTTFGVTACSQQSTPILTEGKKMTEKNKEVVYLDVAVFSYIERPIFDVYLNGKFVGDGGGGLMTGVSVTLGPQALTWRLDGPKGTPRNGDTVKAVNQPMLSQPEKGNRYLGVHIYPDDTVELRSENYWPERTEKGKAIDRQRESKHGR